jgi:uncharacterized RDD family membrane protein YckC
VSDEILTGEGVLLDTRPASFATRTLGALVDLVVLLAVILAVGPLLSAFATGVDSAAASAVGIVLLAAVMVGIPTLVETLSRGRSLGKLAVGIRIVRDDGGPVRFRQAFVRALVGVGELYLTAGGVALISSIVNRKGKRIGDILAGTYATRVRGAQRSYPPLVMPYELSTWARSSDMRRLPDGLALAARQFLGRVASLHPASRAQMGIELAAELQRYVAPGPPVGTHPERFLAALLAERREREFTATARAMKAARAEAALLHRLPHGIPDPVE